MSYLERLHIRIKNQCKTDTDGLETEIQYKERWYSMYVIYFTMFLVSIGTSLIISGMWPYLIKLDANAKKEFIGYVIAAAPIGEMLFSPLIGWWTNHLGSVRLLILVLHTLAMFAYIIYSVLELFSYRKYWILGSRFLIGIYAALLVPFYSYLSTSTRVSERTTAVSILLFSQVAGFIIGPIIQAVVLSHFVEGVWLIKDTIKFDMFTAAGWINVVLAIINFLLFLPFIFKEHHIAAEEAMLKQGKMKAEDTWKDVHLDHVAIWTLLVASFIMVFSFMTIESVSMPMAMDQLAWTKQEALYYMGFLMSFGAVIGCITLVSITTVCKYFPEWKVMVWGGIFLMLLSQFSNIPWGSKTIKMYQDDLKFNVSSNITISKFIEKHPNRKNVETSNQLVASSDFTLTTINVTNMEIVNDQHYMNETELVGCPSSQIWCAYTPALTIYQFVLYYFFIGLGNPMGMTLIHSIYSKLLGPRPQGVWIGLKAVASSLGKVIGPIITSRVYSKYGTIATFGITTSMLGICIIWMLIIRKRLAFTEENLNKKQEDTELIEAKENICDIKI